MKRKHTRRDLCYLVGVRASQLSPSQAAAAWKSLANLIENLGERDVPKFYDLLRRIRVATIDGKNARPPFNLPQIEETQIEEMNSPFPDPAI
jgi:hypothetical protein